MSCGGNATPGGLEFTQEAFRGILQHMGAGSGSLSTVVASQDQVQNYADNPEWGEKNQDNDICPKFSRAVSDKYEIVYVRVYQSGSYFLIIQKFSEKFLIKSS